MQAVQVTHYNREHWVALTDVPEPQVGPDDVLVEVKAAGVNPVDVNFATGVMCPILPTKPPFTLGNEVAGTILSLGANVTNFTVGQAVYARLPHDQMGAFAERVAIAASAIAPIPAGFTFEQAAAVPLTALTAYQALTEELSLQPGDQLFLPGGAGGLGMFAIPFARKLGLRVTTSASPHNAERLKALGAEQVLDYHTTDFANVLHDFDAVIDTQGRAAIPDELKILRRHGTLVSLSALPDWKFAGQHGYSLPRQFIFGAAGLGLDLQASRQHKQYRFMLMHPDGAQLGRISDWLTELHLTPVVTATYSLAQTQAALDRVAAHQTAGKVVITL
ncbi:NADP-dependent oxidoreductase [Levilactobacillus acidifarinae]|uniref:Oxidoreductase n=1 Tax=Levilactobacillus acidifarinae DSM 19394 = JCM 15949 TaxID=1423715 RepID=A0A0R1LRP9_9LACO|nr:NADP-dependent oxidoreductase [Levilactobacillus acidifarinae]KRK95844.1 oxidoreductase [Levilactobacillus acidifarinae DSM 19394]GEO69142.1 oxidoreductase [Levilactobacillus acidifarinae]